MPYISPARRKELASNARACSSGELNYMFTVLINDYLRRLGLTYGHCNDIMGALEGAKQEFYRRVVAPYEDQKIKENGDVY